MSEFGLRETWERAQARLANSKARGRVDRGRGRLHPRVERKLQTLLSQRERPAFSELARELGAYCRAHGLPVPSRSTVYNAVERCGVPRFRMSSLPPAAREALYNLDPAAAGEREIPGDQVVFYALNYGNLTAISFAAGLPWLCLTRAENRPGWRPKSRALLRAVMKYRGI